MGHKATVVSRSWPDGSCIMCGGHHTGMELLLNCGAGMRGLKHPSGAGSGAEAERGNAVGGPWNPSPLCPEEVTGRKGTPCTHKCAH